MQELFVFLRRQPSARSCQCGCLREGSNYPVRKNKRRKGGVQRPAGERPGCLNGIQRTVWAARALVPVIQVLPWLAEELDHWWDQL